MTSTHCPPAPGSTRSLIVSGESGRLPASGFTLIELLVVMAIVAMLLTIAAPRYFRSLERARESVLRQDLAVVRDSIDKFYSDEGRYPQSLEDLIEHRYLRSVPVDPVTRSADTWVLVRSEDPETPGVRDVQSGAPGESLSGQPYGAF
jgi:general secretion pathway protein G